MIWRSSESLLLLSRAAGADIHLRGEIEATARLSPYLLPPLLRNSTETSRPSIVPCCLLFARRSSWCQSPRMDTKADDLLLILARRLTEIREVYPVEQVYPVFAGEVAARTPGLTLEEEHAVRMGAKAMLITSGL